MDILQPCILEKQGTFGGLLNENLASDDRNIHEGSSILDGVEHRRPLVVRPFAGLLHQPWMIDNDDEDCREISEINDSQINRSIWRKSAQCHSGHHRFHICLDQVSNPDRRSSKAATNRLSYGTGCERRIIAKDVKVGSGDLIEVLPCTCLQERP